MAHILMADDDELVGEVVRETLAKDGHVVGLLDDGRDVVAITKLKRPDLVILDCSMPDVPGIEALRAMRNTPEIYDTPVLILTARRSSADVELAMRAGANRYLKKPFDPEFLAAMVEDMLDQRQPHAADLR